MSAWPLGPAGAAYRTSGPVPALFHEDPLFLELCAAFDELLGPFVAALDCFTAYLDPWLAPADFLGWLGELVGAGPSERGQPGKHVGLAGAGGLGGHVEPGGPSRGGGPGRDSGPGWGSKPGSEGGPGDGGPGEPFEEEQLERRAAIAGATRAYRARGTAEGLRAAAALAAGVPVGQVTVAECGAVVWSDTPGTAVVPAFDPVIQIKVSVPAGTGAETTAALVRIAVQRALPILSRLRIDVEES